jgi:hypothetical protein
MDSENVRERIRNYLGDYQTDYFPPAVETYRLIRALSDRWYSELTNEGGRNQLKWYAQVLVFPRQWVSFKSKKAVAAYNEFQKAVLTLGWKQSAYLRHNRFAELDMRRKYQYYLEDKKKAVRSFLRIYALSTLEHLKAIARGEVPGFGLVEKGSQNGPLDEVLQVLKDVVLRDLSGWHHYPAILEPVQADQARRLLLYSFSLPTVLEERPLLGKGGELRRRDVTYKRDILDPLDEFSIQYPQVLAPLDNSRLRFYYSMMGMKGTAPVSPNSICSPNKDLVKILNTELESQFTDQYRAICSRVPFFTACASIKF